MPGGDRTGPMGAGPMTGRGMGLCAGFAGPGYMNGGFGRGFGGRGGRGGWGRRNMFYATGRPGWARGGFAGGFGPAPMTAEHELDALKQEAQMMQGNLEQIQQRIEQLSKQNNSQE